MGFSRRGFVAGGMACALLGRGAVAQFAVGETSSVTRLDLAKIDRERILAAAKTAMGRSPAPTNDASSEAFLQMTLDVPSLAAAAQIDPESDKECAAKAAALLSAWFVTPATRLGTTPVTGAPTGTAYEALLNYSQLAEVAVALAFLPVAPEVADGVKGWFREYMAYLTTDLNAGLARDAKDRHGSSWLLQSMAAARVCGDDRQLEAGRVMFRHATLRAELNADGFFVHDLTSANPFRNSLMNLDLLAGVCVLGSTRFASLWDAELQDGPGMRAAVARHAPYMAKPATWPYPADAEHFRELPGRRPVLALAARAYAQPEYAAEFLTLKEVGIPEILRTMPIRQPLLWVVQPRRRTNTDADKADKSG